MLIASPGHIEICKMKYPILFSFAVMLLASSCATNNVYMNVQEPAPVVLPNSITKVGIARRSLQTKKQERIDKVDQVLSLEGFQLDSMGQQASIKGLWEELQLSGRFDTVIRIQASGLQATNAGFLPPALQWNEVAKVCTDNNVELLMVLEAYDTDNQINYSTVPTNVNTPLGSVKGIAHRATSNTNIKVAWRIYYPAEKILYDEWTMTDRVVLSGQGINPMKAVAAITNRSTAVQTASRNLGVNYAQRLFDYRIRVRRDYFVKGSAGLKAGKRKAQTGNWEGAADTWYREISHPKPKVAGRACYNMAIYNEIQGDLPNAIAWAQQAYEDYGIRLALEYTRLLQDRQSRLEYADQLQNQ